MCLQIYLLEPIIPEKLRLLYNDALSLMKVSILHTSILPHFVFLNYIIIKIVHVHGLCVCTMNFFIYERWSIELCKH
jgi:hypothetical protein